MAKISLSVADIDCVVEGRSYRFYNIVPKRELPLGKSPILALLLKLTCEKRLLLWKHINVSHWNRILSHMQKVQPTTGKLGEYTKCKIQRCINRFSKQLSTKLMIAFGANTLP